MEKDTIYSQWKARRREATIPEDFSARIMARVEKQASSEDYESTAGLAGIRNHLAPWSVAAGLVLLGLFRLFYIAAAILRTHSLVPY